MITFIPISRYRAEFQVAAGRPYSAFERLVLDAVAEGHTSLQALKTLFGIHPRVIIEGLVTLMQSGWVSIGDNNEFEVTPAGITAISRSDILPNAITIATRSTVFVMERVTGQVALGSEILFYPRNKVEKFMAQSLVLPKGDIPNALDPGQIAEFLPKRGGEWIRWIGPIDLVRDNSDFALIDVDVKTERINGAIPPRWEAILMSEVLPKARARLSKDKAEHIEHIEMDPEIKKLFLEGQYISADSEEQPAEFTDDWPMSISKSTVLTGADPHLRFLTEAIQSAASYVAILCSSFSASTIKKLSQPIVEAVGRGVIVNIVRAKDLEKAAEDPSQREALEMLRKLESHSGGKGQLSVSDDRVESRVQILIYDPPEGARGAVGAYSWCGDGGVPQAACVSIVISHPRPLERMCYLIADLASQSERLSTSAGIVKLKNLAADLSAILALPSKENGNVRAELLVDRQNEIAFADAIHGAKDRILIASTEMNQRTRDRILGQIRGITRNEKPSVAILFRHAIDGSADCAIEAASHAGRIQQDARISSNIVLVDLDEVLLSSYDWLNPTIFSRHRAGMELGLRLRGPKIANLFAKLFSFSTEMRK